MLSDLQFVSMTVNRRQVPAGAHVRRRTGWLAICIKRSLKVSLGVKAIPDDWRSGSVGRAKMLKVVRSL